MHIKVTGKSIDVGDSLRSYTDEKLSNLIDKYFDDNIEGSALIGRDHKLFTAEVCIHLYKGFVIKTDGVCDDPYKAVSMAIDRLEDRIKKHKNKIKNKQRRSQWQTNPSNAMGYIIERKDAINEDSDEEHLVIAENERFILTLSVSEAVMKLDLTDVPVVMFENSESGRVNIVYKRPDGHIGWVDYKRS